MAGEFRGVRVMVMRGLNLHINNFILEESGMNMKFLIVENNTRVAALEFFGAQGIEIELATNVERAEFLIENGDFHAVVTGDYLPYALDGEEEGFYGEFIARKAYGFYLPSVIFTFAGHHKDKCLARVLDYRGVELGKTSAGKESVEGWAYAFEMLKRICSVEEMKDFYAFRRDHYESAGKHFRR